MAEEKKAAPEETKPMSAAPAEHTPLDPEACWHLLEDRIRTGNPAMDLDRVRSAYEYAAADPQRLPRPLRVFLSREGSLC